MNNEMAVTLGKLIESQTKMLIAIHDNTYELQTKLADLERQINEIQDTCAK